MKTLEVANVTFMIINSWPHGYFGVVVLRLQRVIDGNCVYVIHCWRLTLPSYGFFAKTTNMISIYNLFH